MDENTSEIQADCLTIFQVFLGAWRVKIFKFGSLRIGNKFVKNLYRYQSYIYTTNCTVRQLSFPPVRQPSGNTNIV